MRIDMRIGMPADMGTNNGPEHTDSVNTDTDILVGAANNS